MNSHKAARGKGFDMGKEKLQRKLRSFRVPDAERKTRPEQDEIRTSINAAQREKNSTGGHLFCRSGSFRFSRENMEW
jgi:hypothetical protein